jgi:hypothetical protein
MKSLIWEFAQVKFLQWLVRARRIVIAAFAAMTIADALGSPINHTFVAARNINGLFTWEDQSAASNPLGVPIGFNVISAQAAMSKDVNAGRGKFALDFRYVMPTLETVSNSTQSGILPAATWAYDCAMFTKFVFSARSTLQNRKDVLKMGPLALANTQLSDWIQTYQQPS